MWVASLPCGAGRVSFFLSSTMGQLVLTAVFSLLLRLVSYVFLEIIPTRLAVPALPLLYIGYLASFRSARLDTDEVKPEPVGKDEKKPLPPLPKVFAFSLLKICMLLTLDRPTTSQVPSSPCSLASKRVPAS